MPEFDVIGKRVGMMDGPGKVQVIGAVSMGLGEALQEEIKGRLEAVPRL